MSKSLQSESLDQVTNISHPQLVGQDAQLPQIFTTTGHSSYLRDSSTHQHTLVDTSDVLTGAVTLSRSPHPCSPQNHSKKSNITPRVVRIAQVGNISSGPETPKSKAGREEDELIAGQPPSIWSTYVKSAGEHDQNLVERWNLDMDVLLVFAGLFTGVVTAFAVNALGDLSENYAQTSAQILRVLVAQSLNGTVGSSTIPPVFDRPDSNAVFVNVVWFLSIICSVCASTGAMLCKLWCTKFRNVYEPSKLPTDYSDMACERQKKLNAMTRWDMSTVVNFLPGLLHVAVALFFTGLWKYLQAKNSVLGTTIGVAIAISAFIYVLLTILPAITEAPFSTPFTTTLLLAIPRTRFIIASIRSFASKLGGWGKKLFSITIWKFFDNASPYNPLNYLWGLIVALFSLLVLLPITLVLTFLIKLPLRTLSRQYHRSWVLRWFASTRLVLTSMFTRRKVSEQREVMRLQIDAITWLLFRPLKYADVCNALRKLLQFAMSEPVDRDIFNEGRLFQCVQSCLRSITREGRVADGRHELASYCVRVLALNRSPKLPRNLPSDCATALDELIEQYAGTTDEEVQLLFDSNWLLPSDRRGEVVFLWTNKNLHDGPKLSDSVFIDLIRHADEWLRKRRDSSRLPTIPDLAYYENARLPSTKVIHAILPYVATLVSIYFPRSDSKDTAGMSTSERVIRLLDTLWEHGRPELICDIIIAMWREDPRSLSQSVAVALLERVNSSQNMEHLSTLLKAITYGPRILTTERHRPFKSLAHLLEQATQGKDTLAYDSHTRDIISYIIQAYAATLENAFAISADIISGHVKEDLLDSFGTITEHMEASGPEDVMGPLHRLSSAFSAIVSDSIPKTPADGSTFSNLVVESVIALNNYGDLKPELVRWIFSIVSATSHKYRHLLEDSVAKALIASVQASADDHFDILQLKVETIIHGPKALPTDDFRPLTTIAHIYARVTDDSQASTDPHPNQLLDKVAQAYNSTVEYLLIKETRRVHDFFEYPQDVHDSLAIMMNPLTNGSTVDPTQLLNALYPLAILFSNIDISTDHVDQLLTPYRHIYIDLLTGTSGLSGDPDDVERNLDLKFYCSKPLRCLFHYDRRTVREESKIRQLLPQLETIALKSSSHLLRWKAIYVIIGISYLYPRHLFFDMGLVCWNILKDLGQRKSEGKSFADPGWKNMPNGFKNCDLDRIMVQIPVSQFLADSVYHWENNIPFLGRDRRPTESGDRFESGVGRVDTAEPSGVGELSSVRIEGPSSVHVHTTPLV